jgi:hypothetical protein
MIRNSRTSTGSIRVASVRWAAVAAGAVLAAGAASLALSPEPLAAASTQELSLPDTDGDGLVDELEAGIGSNPDLVDTDNDGWNDGEEFARRSSPVKAFLHPGPLSLTTAINAHVAHEMLFATAAIYAQDGTLDGKTLRLGVYVNGLVITIPPSSYASVAMIHTVPTQTPGELVFVVTLPVSKKALERAGSMSIFSTISVGSGPTVAADAVNLVYQGGVISQLVASNRNGSNGSLPGGGGGGSGGSGGGSGPGILYKPLGGSNIPANWMPGQLCYQSLSTVGSVGPVVTQEVTSAGCQGGWDGFCDSSNCAASVGSTVEILDPGLLVGG